MSRSTGRELAHSGQRAAEKLAVNRVEDERQHNRTPCLIRVIDKGDSFQAGFMIWENDFVGTGASMAAPRSRPPRGPRLTGI